jgi:hypothetical protein
VTDSDRLVTLESELAEARAQLVRLQHCNTCGGDGKTTHDGPCICGGSGRASDELMNMRTALLRATPIQQAEQRVLDAAVAWGDSCEEEGTDVDADYALAEAIEALAELRSPSSPGIHILHEGQPLCHFTSLLPGRWPPGNSRVRMEEASEATCAECLAAPRPAVPTPYVPPKRNRCRCKRCGDVIESKHRNDHVTCRCGLIYTDGGLDYIRRGALPPATLEDIEDMEMDA